MRIRHKKPAENAARRKTIFWLLSCLLLLLVSSYIYFVNAAAVNAARLGEAASARSARAADIAALETGYLSRAQAVTLSLAYRSGFQDARAVTFIGRKSVGVISRNDDL